MGQVLTQGYVVMLSKKLADLHLPDLQTLLVVFEEVLQ